MSMRPDPRTIREGKGGSFRPARPKPSCAQRREPKPGPAAERMPRTNRPVYTLMNGAGGSATQVKRSGAELLAAAATTQPQNLATSRGGLAREETVATLAHEIAGLECPLHLLPRNRSGAHPGCRPPRHDKPTPHDKRREAHMCEPLGQAIMRVKQARTLGPGDLAASFPSSCRMPLARSSVSTTGQDAGT